MSKTDKMFHQLKQNSIIHRLLCQQSPENWSDGFPQCPLFSSLGMSWTPTQQTSFLQLFFTSWRLQTSSLRGGNQINSIQIFFLFAAYIQNLQKLIQKAEVNFSKYYCLHLIFLVGLKWANKAKDQLEQTWLKKSPRDKIFSFDWPTMFKGMYIQYIYKLFQF